MIQQTRGEGTLSARLCILASEIASLKTYKHQFKKYKKNLR